jgi:hypothetical protein
MVTRRQFLRAGVMGGALLALMRLAPRPAHAGDSAPVLDAPTREALAAIAAVMLAGALPDGGGRQQALAAVVDGVAVAVSGLPPHLQEELGQLFTLLTFAPTRWLLAGVSSPWPRASAEDIAEFLESWRGSWSSLLQSGYHALHELIMAAWYARPDSWPALGYPGPPRLT